MADDIINSDKTCLRRNGSVPNTTSFTPLAVQSPTRTEDRNANAGNLHGGELPEGTHGSERRAKLEGASTDVQQSPCDTRDERARSCLARGLERVVVTSSLLLRVQSWREWAACDLLDLGRN